jgi:hypothetical protein
MWVVVKFNKKYFNTLKQQLSKKLGEDFICYRPKIILQNYKINKLISLEIDLLDDYFFCYHKKFSNKQIINNLQFTKGLKYFLDGFALTQKEITDFINNCKKLEDKNGFISKNLVGVEINSMYKFITGPLTNKIFKIISFHKNKLNILINNFNTTVDKRDFLFNRV